MRWISRGEHTNETIHVLMRSGKHAGQVVQVLDIPHITRRTGGDGIEILLPGLEGHGVIVPSPEATERN